MKQLISLLLFLTFSSVGFSQDFAAEMNDLSGKPIKASLKIFKGNMHPHAGWRYDYTFTKNGKVKTQRNFHRNKLTAEFEYEYDSLGNKTLEKILDVVNNKDSLEVFTTEYFYDKNGRIKKQIQFYQGEKILWIKDSIMYNDKSQVIFYKKTLPAGTEQGQDSYQKYTLTYNEEGQIETSRMTDNFGSSKEVRYSYNDAGDVSKIQTRESFLFEKEEQFGRMDLVYSYKYDKYANWRKRYTRINGSKKQLEVKREITYEK